jgi:hypothetical protein
MNIQRKNPTTVMSRNPGNRNGSVVFIFLTLLAIMMILFAANSRSLLDLHNQLKLLEHRQVERLNASQTNVIGRAELPLGPDTQQRAPAKTNESK